MFGIQLYKQIRVNRVLDPAVQTNKGEPCFGSTCTVGWVNLYQKFEIGKYTVCGKLILPPKNRKALKKFFWGHNWLANLHGFANICKLPVSNTFKDMQSKFDRK